MLTGIKKINVNWYFVHFLIKIIKKNRLDFIFSKNELEKVRWDLKSQIIKMTSYLVVWFWLLNRNLFYNLNLFIFWTIKLALYLHLQFLRLFFFVKDQLNLQKLSMLSNIKYLQKHKQILFYSSDFRLFSFCCFVTFFSISYI